MTYTTLSLRKNIEDGSIVRFDTQDGPVAICNVGGNFYTISDTCTHGEWALSQGWLEGHTIECSLHMAKFDVRTGAVLSPPATCPVKSYATRILGDEVQVDIPESAHAAGRS
ncbi:non-heme iron oxygenase ferredoxin subunit [uncultured Sphingosinicella sp.]|jgi:nitrite reductase/ring-hydroxylating ferredoxin subunit|uniref:non-heme iron oxygenase ferredoxin subunit n=1 Tax=uncultured Sphingosinicella sp. TaxID=478748 RepID=UPI0030DA1814